ncbi:Nitric oxide dioxygenase [Rhizorhabdus wittichii RW1]|uniref:Nitric oxide dioxygenase n=1 Tax=Rhizorhabdus wittichii (strain DSM 6014 / CCUG 31198 / JCM 15750 / NBRC 105917 / EY 4224 / RW1) TaxID=392499 RepID=A0A9J9HA37_RHIWR|nr:Nitric oxide dioxygenase [Rhizorhabdus wittichii RW1]
MNSHSSKVIALSRAMPQMVEMRGRPVQSSIVRDPIPGPLEIVSDGPADNMTAVHTEHMLAFNAEHYDFWAAETGTDRQRWNWAWWGENLTITGVDEESLRVGDIVRIGTAEFRVTSPRIPCFKVAWRIDQPDTILPRMMETGKVGIHLEVLRPGEVSIDDLIEVESPNPENISLAELSRLLLSLSPDDLPSLKRALALPALGAKAAKTVRQRITLIEDRERMRIGRWRGWKPFTVTDIVEETKDIRSFFLTPQDDAPLAPPAAGQFLTVRTERDGEGELVRPWTISGIDLDARHYRLSIKEIDGGAASTRMHRHVAVGDTVMVRPPAGQFVLDRSGFRRVGLVSAGIGVTPMLPMLLAHIERGDNAPPLLWLEVVRNGASHAFRDEVARLLRQVPKLERHIFYTQPAADDRLGIDYDHAGRPTTEQVASLIGAPYPINPFGREVPMPGKETEFYICGPQAFEALTRESLSQLGVKAELIRSETFVTTTSETGEGVVPTVERSTVRFAESGVTAEWHADDGLTLLDLAEAAGLSPLYACRTGVCQSCQCPLRSGEVSYSPVPPIMPASGQVLICCARPASAEMDLAL